MKNNELSLVALLSFFLLFTSCVETTVGTDINHSEEPSSYRLIIASVNQFNSNYKFNESGGIALVNKSGDRVFPSSLPKVYVSGTIYYNARKLDYTTYEGSYEITHRANIWSHVDPPLLNIKYDIEIRPENKGDRITELTGIQLELSSRVNQLWFKKRIVLEHDFWTLASGIVSGELQSYQLNKLGTSFSSSNSQLITFYDINGVIELNED